MSDKFELDESLFPFVVSTWPATTTPADVDRMIRGVNALLERHEKFIHVMDCTRQLGAASAVERKKIADWVQNPRLRALSRYKLLDVLIIRSGLVRGAITAVTWIVEAPSPLVTVERLSDAETAIRKHAEAGGLELPDAAWRRIRGR